MDGKRGSIKYEARTGCPTGYLAYLLTLGYNNCKSKIYNK